jgi:quercetin 2,3-dioxygenase
MITEAGRFRQARSVTATRCRIAAAGGPCTIDRRGHAMSKRLGGIATEECVALGAGGRRVETYPHRLVQLGNLPVARALPVRDRRLVGPWCFLDRFGPLTFADGKPMDVAPHPHIGLQTVSWLLDGEVVHDDSLGFEATLRPGGVNVMTSGGGIAHSEQTPAIHSGRLNGVQLWVALPDAHRHTAAGFAHLAEVPALESPGGVVQVFAGRVGEAVCPAVVYSSLVGADLRVHPGGSLTVPLDETFEHAALVLGGDCALEGQPLAEGLLYYLGTTRSEVSVSSSGGGRLLLVGGPPFPERIVMWWNFVARTPDEIAAARADWEARRRFGEVRAYQGPRLAAPALAHLARPNPVS